MDRNIDSLIELINYYTLNIATRPINPKVQHVNDTYETR